MDKEYEIEGIRNILSETRKLLSEKSFPYLCNALTSSITRIGEPMQLAIIGKISSSKSTLVNGILGKSEIMATGQKEVTYNVGWLKYGNSNSNIIIHHKDGSPTTTTNRNQFERWSVEQNNRQIENVSYIEVFDDSEILKDINIIDTPGLDALRGKDSKNTLDFLEKVRPDAVVMLFTHSISENILEIVEKFSSGTDLSPLNAIGVLSKIDVLWQESMEKEQSAKEIGNKTIKNLQRRTPSIQRKLFNLYPISALMFLATSTITQGVMDDLIELAKSDEKNLRRGFRSVSNFLKPDTLLTISTKKREIILNTIGLYGAYLIVEEIKLNKIHDLSEVKALLWKESGADLFMRELYNHFGTRSKLIKIESIYQHIHQAIQHERGSHKDKESHDILSKIEQMVSERFSSMVQEHKEYEMLYKIYNHEIDLDEEVKEEFLVLCGEKGTSAKDLLGIKDKTEPQTLIDVAQEKENYWRRAIALEPDPEERKWMNIMLDSYSRLKQKIKTMKYNYEQSKSFLFND